MSESLGIFLRRNRELRGISLKEISKNSFIRLDYLNAIEEERFEKLPGMVFAKGYIRTYAKYLGMDSQDAILRFEDRICQLAGKPGKSSLRNKRSGLTLGLLLGLVLSVGVMGILLVVLSLWLLK